MIQGICFDLDGVLVQTDNLHYLAWKGLADRLGEFPVDFHTLLFTTECKAEAAGVICAYRAGLSGEKPPPPKGHTRGLYFRGVQ